MRHDAHAKQARVLRLLPRDSEHRRACTAKAKRGWLEVGGRSWHVAPRPRAEGEEHLAVTASVGRVRAGHNHRGTTRTRSKLECCVSSPETASAAAPAPRKPRGAGLKLEAAAGTSHHGCAPKERGLSLSQRPLVGSKQIKTSVARRVRSKAECCASFPDTESADAPASRELRGAGMKLEAAAGSSHHGRDEGGESLAVAASFGRVRTDHNHRDTTRMRSKLECCVSSPETASAAAPSPREPRGAGLGLEAAAGTSHHGFAPVERSISLSQRHLIG